MHISLKYHLWAFDYVWIDYINTYALYKYCIIYVILHIVLVPADALYKYCIIYVILICNINININM